MPDKAIMIDIETLSTLPSAAVLSIGACIFDPRGDTIEDTFEVVISAQSNEAEGRHISADTVVWWFGQSEKARQALLTNPTNLRNAMLQLTKFIQQHNPTKFYANDPDFDLVILADAYRSLKLNCPWNFWQSRSCRTLKDLATADGSDFPDFTGGGVAHAALDDAIKQAMGVQYVFHKLGA
jgi:hypothetical protein